MEEALNNYECGMLDRRLFHKLIMAVYPVLGQLWSKLALYYFMYTCIVRVCSVNACKHLVENGKKMKIVVDHAKLEHVTEAWLTHDWYLTGIRRSAFGRSLLETKRRT